MLHRPSFARAGAAGLAFSLAALLTGAFTSCSSSDTPPLGGPGATCTKTADCESSLSCIDSVCADPGGMGGGGTGGGTSSSSASSSSGTTSTGTGLSWGVCDTCVEMQCAAELAACDGECLAVQACIETVCANLSAIGAATEGECQIRCQKDHPDGKQTHLALVNCAEPAPCSPPCTFYPQDYDMCRSFMTKGACSAANQACKDSSECQTYKDCVTTCQTVGECVACDDSATGLAGRKVLEAYELCIAGECTAAAWLP